MAAHSLRRIPPNGRLTGSIASTTVGRYRLGLDVLWELSRRHTNMAAAACRLPNKCVVEAIADEWVRDVLYFDLQRDPSLATAVGRVSMAFLAWFPNW
jgi:hypothetical protein